MTLALVNKSYFFYRRIIKDLIIELLEMLSMKTYSKRVRNKIIHNAKKKVILIKIKVKKYIE